MTAVRPVHGIQVKEHEINFVRQIHGVQVKDIITKFFYKDNHLCFHILLQVEGDEIVLFQEFSDYAEYKKVFGDLQAARMNDAVIKIPKKNSVLGMAS